VSAVVPTDRHRYGPSAFGDDLRRFVSLTFTLAVTDFKLRYFGSVLGYFWSLARPLMFFGVLYVVFTQVFRFGEGIEFYPVYLLSSIVLWTFFTETTGGCVQCLHQACQHRPVERIALGRTVQRHDAHGALDASRHPVAHGGRLCGALG